MDLEELAAQDVVGLLELVWPVLSMPSVQLHAVLLLGHVALVPLVQVRQRDLADVQGLSGDVELFVAQGLPDVSLANG